MGLSNSCYINQAYLWRESQVVDDLGWVKIYVLVKSYDLNLLGPHDSISNFFTFGSINRARCQNELLDVLEVRQNFSKSFAVLNG